MTPDWEKMMLSQFKLLAIVLVIALAGGAALGMMNIGWSPPEDAATLLKQAEEAKAIQSYNDAIRKAEAAIKSSPTPDQKLQAQRLIGICQVRLNQFPQGRQTLTQLIAASSKMAEDVEVAEAMAMALVQTEYNDPEITVKQFEKAISLYKAADNKQKQVDLLFAEALYIESRIYQFGISRKVTDYRERSRLGTLNALETYDRVLELNPKKEEIIRAMAGKANIVAQQYFQLRDWDNKQKSTVHSTKYDLNNPGPLYVKLEREIVERFKEDPAAPAALLRLAYFQANQMEDFVSAVKTSNELIQNYPRASEVQPAKQHVDQIKAPMIAIAPAGITTPGQKAKLVWSSRNVKQMELQAFAVDLFDVLRRTENVYDLDKYDLSQKQPALTWTIDTQDKDEHKVLSSKEGGVETGLSESNAYILVARGKTPEGKEGNNRTVLLISRLAMTTKTGKEKAIAFAMDALTGKPVANTQILFQRANRMITDPATNANKIEYVHSDATVPDSGLAEFSFPTPKPNEEHLRQYVMIAKHDRDFAMISDTPYYWDYRWMGNREHRMYVYTDRPVYRPSQTSNFKIVARRYEKGEYQLLANKTLSVRINDPRGNKVYEKDLQTNELGSVAGSLTFSEKPVLGQYYLQILLDGQAVEMSPGMAFRVEEYKKPEYEVQISTEKPTYRVGENLAIKIHGEYYFGGGVADAQVQYTVYRQTYHHFTRWDMPFDWFFDGEESSGEIHRGGFYGRSRPMYYRPVPQRRELVKQGTAKTDKSGNATVEFKADGFAATPSEDVQFIVEANMVDASRRQIRASKTIKVTHQSMYIALKAQQHVYQPKDRVRVTVKGENPNGGPVGFEGKAKVLYVIQREELDAEGKLKQPEKTEAFSEHDVKVGPNGESEVVFIAERDGYFRIDVTAKDSGGKEVVGTTYVWIAKPSGGLAHIARRDLEIAIDKDTFAVGDSMKLLITTKHKQAYVLLTAEADDLYMSRVVFVPENSTVVELPVEKKYQPNVFITASLFRDNQAFLEERQVKVPPVENFLKVALRSEKKEYRPRESAEVEVLVTDKDGKPVETELSLGAIDSSVFYIQPETRGDIRKFFFGRVRPKLVHTRNSFEQGTRYPMLGTRGRFEGRAGNARFDMAESRDVASGAPMPSMAKMEAPASPGGRGGAMAKEKAAMQEPVVRSEFPDTVFWAAHVKTSADGKAKATVRFPDSLTTWRLTAIAADQYTRVGEVGHEVQTKKNILVRLQAPRFFVERDQVVLSANVHNYLKEAKTVQVVFDVSRELTIAGGDKNQNQHGKQAAGHTVEVNVPAEGESRVDVTVHAAYPGRAKVTVKALTDVESDAVQMQYPVLEYGAMKLLASSGILFGEKDPNATAKVDIPADIRDGSQKMTIRVNATIAGVMLESIPYLLEYPYGCTEQTMSRFMPAVLASHTLKTLGVDLRELAKLDSQDPIVKKRLTEMRKSPIYDGAEMQKIITAGVERLRDFQHPDGGWGWWKGDQSNPYLSAYVVNGLSIAKDCGLALPAGMLERGVTFVFSQAIRADRISRYPWQAAEDDSVRVYLMYAVAKAAPEKLRDATLRDRLKEAYRKRDDQNDYSRALLALCLHAAEMKEETATVIANIKDRARIDAQNSTASWGNYDNYYYWYQCGTEATSYSLMALLTIEPKSELIPQVVNWLVRHRKGTRWFNTKDTATVCMALSHYLKQTGELDPDLKITVEVDGGQSKTMHVTRENLFTFDNELILAAETLGTGAKSVRVKREGKGNVYWGVYTTYFSKEEQITEAGNEVYVKRTYERLTPREVEKTRMVYDRKTRQRVEEKFKTIEYDRKPIVDGEKLTSGDLIEVRLDVDARNNFEYVIFEDPKPAGCEAVDLVSGQGWGNGMGAYKELRDEKVAFFATYLNQGKHSISYRLRAEIPGEFHALPAFGECMYTPLVRGNAASAIIKILDAPSQHSGEGKAGQAKK